MTTTILDSNIPSSTIETATKSNQRKDIQGLRAIAVIIVVIFHAKLPLPGGFIGVDIFFVISGYVITSMLYREYKKTQTIDFKTFYARRFKRLTPALALTVSITVILALLFLPPLFPQEITAKTGTGAMLLVANFVIAMTTGAYFDMKAEMNPLLNTWSLSVEEQFYIIFPLLLYIGWKIGKKFDKQKLLKYFPTILVTTFMIGSFVLALIGSQQSDRTSILGFYSPFSRAWEFAAGSLLALYYVKRKPPKHMIGMIASTLGAAMIIIATMVISEYTVFPSMWTLLPVFATLLLIYSGETSNPISALLSIKPMVKIGDWSYSIYLWHWPIIVFAVYLWPNYYLLAPLIGATVSIILALFSYHLLEQPIRKLKNMSNKQKVTLVCSTIIPPLVLAQGVLWTQQHVWQPIITSQAWTIHPGDTGQDDFFAYLQKHYYPCEDQTIMKRSGKWEDVTRCFQTKQNTPVTVTIIGDSHAENLIIGIAEALPNQNVAAYLTFGNNTIKNVKDQNFENIYDTIKNSPTIKTVIYSEYWLKKGTPTPQTLKSLDDLTKLNKKVYIVQDVPDYSFDATICKYRQAPLINITRCVEPKEMYDEKNMYYSQLLIELKATPNITLVETEKFFCTDTQCSMIPVGELLYRDHDHLNIKGSQYLGEKIVESTPGLKQLQQK